MGEAPHSSQGKRAGFTSTAAAPDAALPLPRVFGRLVLLKLIARGGMGDVYLAATTGIEGAERPVVVKTVRRDHVHDGSFLARFLDEARVQSQLHHPGVAQVLEASTFDDGEPYTVVEYIEGRSLSEVRTRVAQNGQKILWPEACAIALEMAQGLAHVHDRNGADGHPLGIVHRDLSPQNVMIGFSGDVKLIDFGTARGHNRRCHTVAGVVFAKPGYVAPEVARQQVGDGRIDLYALGVMLWELIAGRRYYGGDPQKHLEDAAAGRLTMPSLADLQLAPPELDSIIKLLTESDPDDRYASAAQAAADMAKVLSKAPSTATGERGIRARIGVLMHKLWPGEPARARAEFARLLKESRAIRRDQPTPQANDAMETARQKSEADPQLLPGTPYRLLETIGEGASGTVYEAEHIELGRRAAVKVLSAGHAGATDAIERFRREARAVASLAHPNLVHLYDFGRAVDGRIFIAMELLKGETLHERAAREGQLEWREAVKVGIEVTHALEAAHDAGLVHRDLKPANLFLTELSKRDSMRALPLDSSGPPSSRSLRLRDVQTPSASIAVATPALPYGVKLLDFGVAMAVADVQGEEKRQRGFAVFGTPEYMAPEQVAGEPVDGRCDLYALGCVLYELVTGTRPFVGPSAVVVMGKQLREEPEAIAVRAPGTVVPAALEALIARAMSKSAKDRFADAAELREALEDVLMPVAIAAPAPSARKKAFKAMGLAGTFAAVGLAAFGAVTFATKHLTHDASMAANANANAPSLSSGSIPASTSNEVNVAGAAPTNIAPLPAAAAAVAASDTNDDPDDSTSVPSVTNPAAQHTVPATRERETSRTVAVASSPSSSSSAKLDEARAAAVAHPKDAKALRGWALAAAHAGDVAEARRADAAWGKVDGTSEPRIFLANVLESNGKHEGARLVLQNWLDDHPESTDARRLYSHLGGAIGNATASARKVQR